MTTQTPQPGENGTAAGRATGITPKSSLSGTQLERRLQLVLCNVANAVTKNLTNDAHLKIVCKTGSSKNTKQHAIGCKNIHNISL